MQKKENNNDPARLIAFYLPQYHPLPENDAWWGKGFTEWTNVSKAQPQFSGHYQPHIPADLGFYDLRLAEARKAQAELAREYGIHGFCYYHYWFNGKRLLERPLHEVLTSGDPDFPFCLCWANENWTRGWDGGNSEILMQQHYSEEDDLAHIRYLSEVFKDKRYIRINGRPLFLVYRAKSLPDSRKTTKLWRDEARRLGVGEIYLCSVESFTDERADPVSIGFDAAIEFQPDCKSLSKVLFTTPFKEGSGEHSVVEYKEVVTQMLKKPVPPYKLYPCVTPSWDNSPRRKTRALIFSGSTPPLYEKWLSSVLSTIEERHLDEKIVFINAWNEWGEGNHLEPDQKFKRGFLEATRNSLLRATQSIPLYHDILKKDPKNASALHDLGIIAFKQGKYESAAEYFLKALAIKPDYAVAHNNLGFVFKELGRKEEAKICYEAAIALKPDYEEARKNLEELTIKKPAHSPVSLSSVKAPSVVQDSKVYKKLAFVDLGFHKKTKSTLELIEIFKKYFQVDIYWDDGNLDFQQMAGQNYDTVIFFQKLYGVRKLNALNARNIIFIPMYDDVMGITDSYWRQFSNLKFLNFSRTLHEKLLKLGLNSSYIQYFVPFLSLPDQAPPYKGLSGFLWQRTNHIRWSTISKLIQNARFEKFHLHSAVDPPNHSFERPSSEDIKKYRITITDWFPGKEAYLSLVNASNIFFAPRVFEGIGMSFLEAMAMGKCVVAPNLPTMNEYIKHGENGLLYDPANPAPLDLSQADQLGQMARIAAQEGYRQWKENEKNLIQFILGESVQEKIKIEENVL